MTNKEIAKLLRNVATAYELSGDNPFRVIAYNNAADSVEHLTTEANDLWKAHKLSEVSGIGKAIYSYLEELFKTGHAKHWETVLRKIPLSVYPLLDIPGLGPKKAFKLVTLLCLDKPETVISLLKGKCLRGEVAKLPTFGEKSEKDILAAIEYFQKGRTKENRMSLPYADAIARNVITYLRKLREAEKIDVLGSLRRRVATIGDIDIAVATHVPHKVIDWFLDYPKKEKLIEKGPTGASIIVSGGRQIDLRVQNPASYGAMLQYFTGSKNHNIRLREFALKKGWSLSEYGIKKRSKIPSARAQDEGKDQRSKKIGNYNTRKGIYEYSNEEDFYNALGLAWIPPEMREDNGEINKAKENQLPKLLELQDVKGDLQIHSNFPVEPSHDLGTATMEELVKKAESLGYFYVALTDHNPSVSNHNNKQIIEILKRRKDKIEQINQSTKSVRVFNMLEIDILADGKVALPEIAFAYIDAALVGIHSGFNFNLDKKQMTKRVIQGLSHPKVKILAHPTARIIGQRTGVDLDWSAIFEFCLVKQKALEINAHPSRLDLPDDLIREARKYKIKFSLGTDSHDLTTMEYMEYGVFVGRRGWLTKDDILNTMEYNTLKKWLDSE